MIKMCECSSVGSNKVLQEGTETEFYFISLILPPQMDGGEFQFNLYLVLDRKTEETIYFY